MPDQWYPTRPVTVTPHECHGPNERQLKFLLSSLLTIKKTSKVRMTGPMSGGSLTKSQWCWKRLHMTSSYCLTFVAMEPYKKLCEVGACLYQSKRYELCLYVLGAAQKVATNQKGITMKVLLTMANAHSKLRQRDVAISIFQVRCSWDTIYCFLNCLDSQWFKLKDWR